MISKKIGFIGGGRAAKIFLGGFQRAGEMPEDVVVSDTNIDALNGLKEEFPGIRTALGDNRQAAMQDIVFIGLHPPVMTNVLSEIQAHLNADSILVSLAPKLTIARIAEMLDGFQRIVRMIPNAPSIINEGYNPIVFSKTFSDAERGELLSIFATLGESPEVGEELLEAYTILTAIGPTYLWFQLYELQELGKSFGLSDHQLEEGILKMVTGTVKTMYNSGLPPQEVMDLILLKPLAEEEENIKNIYRSKLEALYSSLK